MSESTLSISYEDLTKAVRVFLGMPAGSTDESDKVDMYVQSGVRNFYYPHAVEGVDPNFEWTFLKPVGEIVTVADTEDYDLPDDFGRIAGNIFFESDLHVCPIIVVSESEIMLRRQSAVSTGYPQIASVRHKESDGTDGQRQEICFYPTPSEALTLSYRYEAFAGKLTSTALYPLGGMKYSELIVESCLAVAEQRANDERGLHTQQFERMLIAAVKRDSHNGAKTYGHMGSPDPPYNSLNRSNGTVTYNGNSIA